MPPGYPQQNFASLTSLINYINAQVITNGNNAITGVVANNVFNGLASFLESYLINFGLVTIDSSTGSVVVLSKPMTVFTGAPTSIQWPGNPQNEYYVTNATAAAIEITNGFSYTDQYGTTQTSIPARTSVHIAKATNGSWVLMNNLSGTSGGGGLPPQPGHLGQFLSADGGTGTWADTWIFVTNVDFLSDGVTCILPIPDAQNYKFDIFFDTLSGFIYEQDGQWSYYSNPGGSPPEYGFKILIAGINANSQQVRAHVLLKGLNS